MTTLRIKLPMGLIFELRPTLPAAPGLPDEHEVTIRGDLFFVMDKPRLVQDITIKLTSVYIIPQYKDGSPRAGTLFKLKKSLLPEPTMCEGKSLLPFSFSVPSTIAPYERCKYGRTEMKLQAKIKLSGFLERTISTSQELYMFYIAAAKGSIPDSLAMRSEQYNSDLGPFLVEGESSEGLIVSGLVNFRCSFPSPPAETIVEFISGVIHQNFHITDPKKPEDGPWHPPAQVLTLFLLNGHNRSEASEKGQETKLALKPIANYDPRAPFGTLQPGKEEAISLLVHLPNDDYLRGTSSPLSQTPFHSTHELVITIRFKTSPTAQPQEVQLTKPLSIAHCHCVSDNLLLPEYSHIDENPLSEEYIAFTRSSKFEARHSDCQCSKSAEALLARAKELGLDKVYTAPIFAQPPELPPKR